MCSRTIIDRLCGIVEEKGNIDSWWTLPVSSLMQDGKVGDALEKGKVRN